MCVKRGRATAYQRIIFWVPACTYMIIYCLIVIPDTRTLQYIFPYRCYLCYYMMAQAFIDIHVDKEDSTLIKDDEILPYSLEWCGCGCTHITMGVYIAIEEEPTVLMSTGSCAIGGCNLSSTRSTRQHHHTERHHMVCVVLGTFQVFMTLPQSTGGPVNGARGLLLHRWTRQAGQWPLEKSRDCLTPF